MRIFFAGSPGIAVPALEALAELRGRGICELVGTLTNPDSPRGRHGRPEPTEAALAAEALGVLPLLKPEKLDAGARDAAAALKPDLLVSFAYGRIFGPKFLALFPKGGINIHPSLLPKYRGPSPIQGAILGREAETGISIQRLALEMDSGDILAQERIALSGRETAPELSGIAAQKGAAMLGELIPRFLGGDIPSGIAQDHAQATYCSLISREDGRIDWALSAADIDARIRAFDPWPLCFTMHGERELCILEGQALSGAPGASEPPGTALGIDKRAGILIQTGEGVFAASRLQYRAKKALEWRAFVNGAKNFIGTRLI